MAERQFELTRDTLAVAYALFTAWINRMGRSAGQGNHPLRKLYSPRTEIIVTTV